MEVREVAVREEVRREERLVGHPEDQGISGHRMARAKAWEVVPKGVHLSLHREARRMEPSVNKIDVKDDIVH